MHAKPGLHACFLLARLSSRLGDHWRYAAKSDAKLDWLRDHGELIEIPVSSPFPPTYRFRSREGIDTGFVIRDGQMIFLTDHTTSGAVDIGE